MGEVIKISCLERLFAEKGQCKSWHFNMVNGKYRVRYKNGHITHPMCLDVAEDYAEIFNGTVERI